MSRYQREAGSGYRKGRLLLPILAHDAYDRADAYRKARMKAHGYHVLRDARHYVYDNAIAPALEISSGDTVCFECPEAADGQFTAASTNSVLDSLDWSRVHAMTGPIAVTGARPGDTLKVDILELAHHGWGWSSVIPGFGLLAEEFGDSRLVRIWKVDDAGFARFLPEFRVPIDPFMGEMGVAWAEPGPQPTMPPTLHGWNMDSRHTGAGCTLYFPVMVPGALFSTGDGHLAQGDGEVCGVAIEAPLDVTMRFTLLRGQKTDAVRFETRRPTTAHVDGMGHHVTSGTGPDLQQSARDAVRRMLDLIEQRYGLAREDAYILCSVAADLKIAVPVLGPGHASHVTYHLPKSIFT
jgi:acetamidase/formamidase